MSSFSRDEMDWANSLATKLRFLQADCADIDPGERQHYIEEAIQRSLSEIVPEKRADHLRVLVTRFPIGEGANGASLRNNQTSISDQIQNSPEALVEQLEKMAPLLPKRKLQELGLRLQQAGYLEIQTTALMDEPPPEFLQRFPLEPGTPVDLQRLYKLIQSLADFMFSVDKVAWNVWKALAPRSRVKRDAMAGDFRTLGGRYLAGDKEVSIVQVNQVLDRLRQLVAGILTGIGAGGRSFVHQFLNRFSPDAIKDLAGMEGGLFASIEQKCWRKYVDLAKENSEDALELEIQEAIARYAEDLMRGTARTPDV